MATKSASHVLRGRVAGLSRSRQSNDPEFVAARRDLAAHSIEQYARRVLEAAPPLTEDQADRIAAILRSSLHRPSPRAGDS